jgi:hypothetical protein
VYLNCFVRGDTDNRNVRGCAVFKRQPPRDDDPPIPADLRMVAVSEVLLVKMTNWYKEIVDTYILWDSCHLRVDRFENVHETELIFESWAMVLEGVLEGIDPVHSYKLIRHAKGKFSSTLRCLRPKCIYSSETEALVESVEDEELDRDLIVESTVVMKVWIFLKVSDTRVAICASPEGWSPTREEKCWKYDESEEIEIHPTEGTLLVFPETYAAIIEPNGNRHTVVFEMMFIKKIIVHVVDKNEELVEITKVSQVTKPLKQHEGMSIYTINLGKKLKRTLANLDRRYHSGPNKFLPSKQLELFHNFTGKMAAKRYEHVHDDLEKVSNQLIELIKKATLWPKCSIINKEDDGLLFTRMQVGYWDCNQLHRTPPEEGKVYLLLAVIRSRGFGLRVMNFPEGDSNKEAQSADFKLSAGKCLLFPASYWKEFQSVYSGLLATLEAFVIRE